MLSMYEISLHVSIWPHKEKIDLHTPSHLYWSSEQAVNKRVLHCNHTMYLQINKIWITTTFQQLLRDLSPIFQGNFKTEYL